LKNNDNLIQAEVFFNLKEKGVSKIISELKENQNESIRKLYFRLLLSLVYNNESIQNSICDKFKFSPIGSKICVNWIPDYLITHTKIDQNSLYEIKNTKAFKDCKYWMWPYSSNYDDNNIPDPQKYLMGFYYPLRNISNIGNNLVTSDFLETKLFSHEINSTSNRKYVSRSVAHSPVNILNHSPKPSKFIKNEENLKVYKNTVTQNHANSQYNQTTGYTYDLNKSNISRQTTDNINNNSKIDKSREEVKDHLYPKFNFARLKIKNPAKNSMIFINKKLTKNSSNLTPSTIEYHKAKYNQMNIYYNKSTEREEQKKTYFEIKKINNYDMHTNAVLKKLKTDYKNLISNSNPKNANKKPILQIIQSQQVSQTQIRNLSSLNSKYKYKKQLGKINNKSLYKKPFV
jgi:hypothetical protein